MRHTSTTTLILAAALGAGLALAAPQDAEACGGFFCSQNAPVNQAAERIIFSENGDGTVTAVVQIQYAGPSERFAWVLPVPGVPDIGVSSDAVFTRLQSASNPQYNLTTTVEGTCRTDGDFAAADGSVGGSASNAAPNQDGSGGGVNVLASGSVGPYDFVVIMVEPQRDDLADVAIEWLQDNNYDVTAVAPDLIRPYLEDGMNLVAFRLTKGNSDGDIRPVVLTYDTESPMIPIKLTAVAADDNMGVLVWVLSEERAVPINYRSLQLNEALINWFNASSTYNDVINIAADEAGGQGFVTEFAGESSTFASVIRTPADEGCLIGFPAEPTEGQIADTLQNLFFGCQDAAGVAQSLREALPEEDMQDISGFASCVMVWGVDQQEGTVMQCTDFQFGESFTFDFAGIDTARLPEALRENVIEPLEEAQALFNDRPYTTRLYTTMSAAEMTVDPVFMFNPDLDAVDNIHQAERVIECSSSVYQWEAPWRVELPQGDVIRGEGSTWPVGPGSMPANRQVLQDSTAGSPEVIEDNTAAIAQALEVNNTQYPGGGGGGDGCGCATVDSRSSLPGVPVGLGLVLLGCVVAVRRRR